MNLKNNIDLFIKYCTERKTLSNKTTRAYQTDLNRYLVFSKENYCKDSLCEYISYLHKNFKPKTAKPKFEKNKEEDLIAELQRLRIENEYLKSQGLVCHLSNTDCSLNKKSTKISLSRFAQLNV